MTPVHNDANSGIVAPMHRRIAQVRTELASSCSSAEGLT